MRLLICLVIVLVVAPILVFGQAANSVASKFDEFALTPDVAFDDMKARLDGFYATALKDSNSRAYVFIYRGKHRSSRYTVSNVRDYLVLRGLPSDRMVVINGGRRESPAIELWVVPQGAAAPKPTPPSLARRRPRR